MTTWKTVDGFDGRYQICVDGRLLRNACLSSSGKRIQEKMLKPYAMPGGYFCYSISWQGKNKVLLTHRLIAQAFIPNPDGKPEVNHIDGNKLNNALENLEWATHQENMSHAFRTGLTPMPRTGPGETSPSAKLTEVDVASIRRLLSEKVTQREIADRFGVAKGTIGFIARGETWAQVQAHAAGTLGVEFA